MTKAFARFGLDLKYTETPKVLYGQEYGNQLTLAGRVPEAHYYVDKAQFSTHAHSGDIGAIIDEDGNFRILTTYQDGRSGSISVDNPASEENRNVGLGCNFISDLTAEYSKITIEESCNELNLEISEWVRLENGDLRAVVKQETVEVY